MADLSSILGGMIQGFKDFGTGVVDLFGTGGAAIGDLIQSGGTSTKNQDDFRKWLYQTDNTQDAAAKGLGTILNGVQTVADVIPGAQAVTANPLFNGLQGAVAGVSDELKMAGKDVDWGRAAQRAGVGGASGLLSAAAGQKLQKTGNKMLSNGLTRGAVQGAIGGGIANAGYTGIEGGSVQDMINAGLYGAQTGALVGGTTGLARELIKPTTKMDAALTDEEKAARIANIDDQLAKLDTSTPEGSARYNELMAARDNYANDKMIRLYRGMSAEDVPTLKQYYDDMRNTEIQPKQYSGASLNGRGYDTAPDFRTAESYAETSGNGPSMGVFEIDLPEESFVPMTKELGNRETDFIIRAHDKFGGYNPEVNPKYNPEALAIGKQDFQNYLKSNNIAGSVNPDKSVYTIMNSDVVGDFRASKMLPQAQNYLETNGYASLDDVPNPKTVADLMVESKPKTYYHGSPETDITEFDMGRAGKNTRSGEKAIYFTDTPEAAEEFAYERIPTDSNFIDKAGKRGGVYEANLDIRNTLDLDNLTDAQIKELWPYASNMGSWQGEDVFARDIKHWRDVKNPQLIKGYLDLEKLANSPYDSLSATMYPNTGNKAKEYAIFDASKAKITKSPKTVADLMAEKKTPSNVAELMAEKKPTSSKGVTRIGSSQVAPIDKSTLPKGWAELQDIIDRGYMDDITNKFGYESGAWDKLTPEQLRTYILDAQEGPNLRKGWESRLDVFEQMSDSPEEFKKTLLDVASHEAKSKAERAIESLDMPQDQKNAITYAANRANEGWKEEKRYISNYPKGAEGKKGWENNATSEADAEFSDRLGIGRSNTLKQDEVPRGHDAAGQYLPGEYTMAIQPYLNKENSVSTLAHERLHSFQFEAPEGRYDKRVINAYNELSKDLKPFIHDKKTIQSRYKTVGDTEYWARPIEQEARMVQQYLDNKGFTKNAVAKYRQGEWGKEINPAFDKFFNTLRKLSKKGVALPALTALFGGGAIMAATQNNDKKKKSEVK